MAKFTRAEIRSILGEAHTDEIENRLIALHLGVVDPLKDQLQTYKADAEKLPDVQKELGELKAKGDGGYKEKYDAEVKAHQDYRKQVEAEKTAARDEADVLALGKEAGIARDSALRLVAKVFDRTQIKRGEDGKITNKEALVSAIKTEYADLVGTPGNAGTPPADPPSGNGGSGGQDDLGKLDMAAYIAARKKM